MPDAAAAAHCDRMADHLDGLLRDAGGTLPFSRFMHELLYAPGLGYYAAGSVKFGPAGDFVTAPEISPLFGYVLARQIVPLLDALGGGDVLEAGAGSGALAVSVLTRCAALGSVPDRYLILEVSPDLQQRQAALIRERLPDLFGRVQWIPAPPPGFRGVVIANEVLDALPVERFQIDAGRVMRLCVQDTPRGFDWCLEEPPEFLADAVRQIEADIGRKLAERYRSEFAPAALNWVRELSAVVEAGVVLLLDYGVSRREYYAPDRSDGWLRCHFRHNAHDDPLVLPGIQDVTAWVDFSAVAAAAAAAGFEVAGFVSQAQWLLVGGIDQELMHFTDLPAAEQVRLSGQVKLLTLPGEMGESFKCMGLRRGDVPVPDMFAAGDRAHQL